MSRSRVVRALCSSRTWLAVVILGSGSPATARAQDRTPTQVTVVDENRAPLARAQVRFAASPFGDLAPAVAPILRELATDATGRLLVTLEHGLLWHAWAVKDSPDGRERRASALCPDVVPGCALELVCRPAPADRVSVRVRSLWRREPDAAGWQLGFSVSGAPGIELVVPLPGPGERVVVPPVPVPGSEASYGVRLRDGGGFRLSAAWVPSWSGQELALHQMPSAIVPWPRAWGTGPQEGPDPG